MLSLPPTERKTPIGSRAAQLTDIGQLAAIYSHWEGRIEQISSGNFHAELQIVSGGFFRALSVVANQRVRIRGRDASGLFWINPVSRGSSESLWQGRKLTVGQLVVPGVECVVDHLSARQTSHQSIAFVPRVIEDAVRSLCVTEAELPRSWSAVSSPPGSATRAERLIAQLLHVGLRAPEFLGSPDGQHLAQECLRSIVNALNGKRTPGAELVRSARIRLVSKAETYMRERIATPIAAVDLCRTFGVSDRTLRLAFREQYGMGPMTYFKMLRLNAVRASLKKNRLLSIKDAAVACGFHHLGNFAGEYRRLFGERPSVTPR